MPKLYQVSIVDWLDLYTTVCPEMGSVLVIAENAQEAIHKAEGMFDEEISELQVDFIATEISGVDGYDIHLVKPKKPRKFYFTFGSWEGYPYQGGWVEVIAPSRSQAFKTFRKHYPNREDSPFYNCSDCYDSNYFESCDMFINGNLGAFCHAVIEREE